MGVGDPADIGERLVEFEMSGQIGRRPQVAVDHTSVEIGDDDRRRRQLLIGNAARLDGNQPLFARNATDIAECEFDHAFADQILVRLHHFFTQFRKQHGDIGGLRIFPRRG